MRKMGTSSRREVLCHRVQDFSHFKRESFVSERLFKEGDVSLEHVVPNHGVVGVSGDVQHSRPRP
jgi:hypothetical protein